MDKLLSAALVCLVLLGCGQESKTQAEAKPEDYMTIGMKPDEFKVAFNRAAELNQSEFRISVLNVKQEASGQQFLFQFNRNIGLLGTVNKYDGTIRSLTTIASGDGTPKSGANMVLIMHDVIDATNPSVGREETAKIAINLFQGSVAKMGSSVEEVRNGIRYAAIFQNGVGMIFVADQKRY